MNKHVEIEIGEKTYKLGFPNRMAVITAERYGLDVTSGRLIEISSKMFYAGLLAYQEVSEEEAYELMDTYISEGGDIDEIVAFLSEQYQNFIKSPAQGKKNTKKMKIIE